MSAQSVPQRIELLAMADKGARFKGQIPVGQFERLVRETINSTAWVAFDLEFGKDPEGVRFARVRARVDLILNCQRCLAPLNFECAVDTTLGLAASDAEVACLPERYEAHVGSGDSVATVDLIEDELLLCLPLAPKHERCEPLVPTTGEIVEAGTGPAQSPFSVLAALKGRLEPDKP